MAVLLAPLFFVFEFWQLFLSERYLGVKQIARNGDPRTLGLGEFTAFCWTAALLFYFGWMIFLLLESLTRFHGLSLLVVSALGFSLRRNTSLKWTLVILTFEGGLRISVLLWLTVIAWRRL